MAPYEFRVDGTQILESAEFRKRAKVYEKTWELRCFLGCIALYQVEVEDIPVGFFVVSVADIISDCHNNLVCLYRISTRTHLCNGFRTNYRYLDDFLNRLKEIEAEGYVPLDRSEHPLFRDAAQQRTKEAILEWTKCALRLKLPRDLRNLIAREMWRERKLWIL